MNRVGRAMGVAIPMALAGALFSGCGLLGDAKESKGAAVGVDMQEAAERADAMLDATIAAVVPKIQWTHDTTTIGSCDLSRYRTVMTIISEQRRGNFLGVIERFWQKSGYKITDVNKSKAHPAIFATSADGFGISLIIGDRGQAFFEVATPCVRESEVADPTAEPNGPDYAGGEIPYPDVRSDFWSAESPAVVASPQR
ncbi:hypothetical protein [Streptomyces sp. NPDC002133]|uniref:hypothetical protein n=1 Tax=Streptomyces sp. NPDC002133 TaxID=3154409 RepID=UPI00331B73D2